jgi:hypothetical protein
MIDTLDWPAPPMCLLLPGPDGEPPIRNCLSSGFLLVRCLSESPTEEKRNGECTACQQCPTLVRGSTCCGILVLDVRLVNDTGTGCA